MLLIGKVCQDYYSTKEGIVLGGKQGLWGHWRNTHTPPRHSCYEWAANNRCAHTARGPRRCAEGCCGEHDHLHESHLPGTPSTPSSPRIDCMYAMSHHHFPACAMTTLLLHLVINTSHITPSSLSQAWGAQWIPWRFQLLSGRRGVVRRRVFRSDCRRLPPPFHNLPRRLHATSHTWRCAKKH